MKKGFILGMAMAMTLQTGSLTYANTVPRFPANETEVTQAQAQVANNLHKADLLAAKVLVQLEYLRQKDQVQLDTLAFGTARDQGLSFGLAIESMGQGLPVLLALGGLIWGASHTFSFEKPGVHWGTQTDLSLKTWNHRYTVTWKGAYGPFILAGSSVMGAAGSAYLLKGLDTQAASTELGRKLMGFDPKLNALVTSGINDLSEILELSSEQRRALTDAVTESVLRQIHEKKESVDLDILGVAKAANLLDAQSESALKNIMFVALKENSLEALQTELESSNRISTDVQARIEALKNVQNLLKAANAKSPEAAQKLQKLNLRISSALTYLSRF